jgi:hypothetical protein
VFLKKQNERPSTKFDFMSRVTLSLNNLKVDEKITFAMKVHDMMSANAGTFAEPDVEMPALLTKAEALQTAQANAIDGGKLERAIRDAAELELDTALRKLANYVENVSEGDAVLIAQAGMVPRKPRVGMIPDTPAPSELRAGNTITRTEVRLAWKKASNINGHEVQVCPHPITEDGWQLVKHSTRSRVVIQGLEAGKTYWFRVRGFSAAGTSEWSGPVSKVVGLI